MEQNFRSLSIEQLLRPEGFDCACGRHHSAAPLREVVIRQGAIADLPAVLGRLGVKRPYVVADHNTYAAAGEKVCEALRAANVDFGLPTTRWSPTSTRWAAC